MARSLGATGSRWKERRRRLLTFLWFFRPVKLPAEIRPGTPESVKFKHDLSDLRDQVGALQPETVDHLIGAWRDEYDELQRDIDGARSRGAQLLAVTGFLSVLVTLTSSSPPTGAGFVMTAVALGLLGFFFAGAVWLTYHTIRVSAWEQVVMNPIPPQSHGELDRARREYASQLLVANSSLRMRLRVPTGYLRDAYAYFAITSVLVLSLVFIHFFTGTPGSSGSGSVVRPTPTASAAPLQTSQPAPTHSP